MKHGDKFKHKSGVVYTLLNLSTYTYKEEVRLLTYDIDCWILVSRDNNKHRQWCAVDEGNTALGAFGGHFSDFTAI